MRTCSLILLLLLAPLTGCVVTYGDFPEGTLESLSERHDHTILPASPGFEECDLQPPPLAKWRHVVVDILEKLNFFNPLYWLAYPRAPEPPQFVSARLQGLQVPVQGGQVVFVSRPNSAEVSPQERPACVARITTRERLTFMEGLNATLSGATLTIIPVYTPDAVIYSVTFSVSIGERPAQVYQYSMSKGGVSGLLTLPFAWINLFTSSKEEVLRAIVWQFLLDAQRDGNL